jgi:hypothetical protein
MESHYKQQQSLISEALCELMAAEDDCRIAHQSIIGAIDEWLSYHESEARKWRTLRIMVQGPEML